MSWIASRFWLVRLMRRKRCARARAHLHTHSQTGIGTQTNKCTDCFLPLLPIVSGLQFIMFKHTHIHRQTHTRTCSFTARRREVVSNLPPTSRIYTTSLFCLWIFLFSTSRSTLCCRVVICPELPLRFVVHFSWGAKYVLLMLLFFFCIVTFFLCFCCTTGLKQSKEISVSKNICKPPSASSICKWISPLLASRRVGIALTHSRQVLMTRSLFVGLLVSYQLS